MSVQYVQMILRHSVRVVDQASGQLLTAEATTLDLGQATLRDLTTDHGNYLQAQPGRAELTAYGSGLVTITVRTGSGALVYATSELLDGYRSLAFAIPTTVLGDEQLTATLVAADGSTASQTVVYNVQAAFDSTPPQLSITAPLTDAVIVMPNLTTTLLLTGWVTVPIRWSMCLLTALLQP